MRPASRVAGERKKLAHPATPCVDIVTSNTGIRERAVKSLIAFFFFRLRLVSSLIVDDTEPQHNEDTLPSLRMSPFDLVALSVIQGVTEFLPISSSAHAALYSAFFAGGRHAVSLDAALHGGTLVAMLVCFRKEWTRIAAGAITTLRAKKDATTTKEQDNSRLLWRIVVASLPLVFVGGIVSATDGLEALPRAPQVIATTSVLFALLLLFADMRGKDNPSSKRIEELSLTACLSIGALQCCALLPGSSRAGVVMTAALLCGLGRVEAARLAVLTSLPALAGATALGVHAVVRTHDAELLQDSLLAASLAAVVAGLTLRWFMRAVARVGFLPFVLYRCALGALIVLALGFGA